VLTPGNKGRQIVGMDAKKLTGILNIFFTDEWWAFTGRL